jgi:riboflavin biosynthesis pyrimidine reductase
MEGLIDEYNLFVNPVALGKGMTIFNDLEGKLNREHVNFVRTKELNRL